MKHLFLCVVMLTMVACSKEKTYSPWNLKNGQEVELLVNHRYGAIEDPLILLPQQEAVQIALYGFTDRMPGYNYRVKAKLVVPEVPPQDGPSYHLELTEVLSREKYEGNEPFDIALIQSYVTGGPTIMLGKQDGVYYFVPEKLALISANDEVKAQLEEISDYVDELRENWQNLGISEEIKWKSITATVTHDPDNFGKAYLVEHMEFRE